MATKNKNFGLEEIKATTKTVNTFIIDTTEIVIDETIDRTLEWQNVADKAIKGGFKLAKKQADITFKVLETLKKQWKQGQENFVTRVND